MVFGCFVCFVSVTAENGAISLSLSLSLFFREEYVYAHAHVFLAKKKGEID